MRTASGSADPALITGSLRDRILVQWLTVTALHGRQLTQVVVLFIVPNGLMTASLDRQKETR